MRRETLTEEEINRAYEEWCGGAALEDVAARLYISPRTLQRSFSRRGKKKPKEHRAPNKRRHTVVDKQKKSR